MPSTGTSCVSPVTNDRSIEQPPLALSLNGAELASAGTSAAEHAQPARSGSPKPLAWTFSVRWRGLGRKPSAHRGGATVVLCLSDDDVEESELGVVCLDGGTPGTLPVRSSVVVWPPLRLASLLKPWAWGLVVVLPSGSAVALVGAGFMQFCGNEGADDPHVARGREGSRERRWGCGLGHQMGEHGDQH